MAPYSLVFRFIEQQSQQQCGSLLHTTDSRFLHLCHHHQMDRNSVFSTTKVGNSFSAIQINSLFIDMKENVRELRSNRKYKSEFDSCSKQHLIRWVPKPKLFKDSEPHQNGIEFSAQKCTSEPFRNEQNSGSQKCHARIFKLQREQKMWLQKKKTE